MAVDPPAAVKLAPSRGEIMEIQIPEGVQPGQTLMIAVPDGREATLVVPDGVFAGSSLTLFFDSIAGTLSRLDRAPATVPQRSPASTTPAAAPVELPSSVLVQLPTGVRSGQSLAVAVPSGRHVNFCVPMGATEGQTLHLWFDPVNDTLTPMA